MQRRRFAVSSLYNGTFILFSPNIIIIYSLCVELLYFFAIIDSESFGNTTPHVVVGVMRKMFFITIASGQVNFLLIPNLGVFQYKTKTKLANTKTNHRLGPS